MAAFDCALNCELPLFFPSPFYNDDLLLFYHDGQHMSTLMTTACDRACN